jgi:hypothetical protein
MPKPVRGVLRSAPGWLLAKLALDGSLRGDTDRQVLPDALETIIAATEIGDGQIIVVDADNAGLVDWYLGNGFRSTGGPDLRLYVKVATARTNIATLRRWAAGTAQ